MKKRRNKEQMQNLENKLPNYINHIQYKLSEHAN